MKVIAPWNATGDRRAPAFVRHADTTPGTQAASALAVELRGVGKEYFLGGSRKRSNSLREDVMRFFSRMVRGNFQGVDKSSFWALKDIDLDVARGETVGIIGANGAGKSTLLKLLSRITYPTEGWIRFRGRMASLLEVGTGFHRELTGRENIYLNGAILGMRQHEIRSKLDAIVDFAGVEKFLDTAVKFYSSGMYVRLAFAVAAHLQTDILIIDEVLAVGDAEFQKKCLGKMQDAASSGRTVLFVSHSPGAVRQLCKSALLLQQGKMVHRGTVEDCLERYMPQSQKTEAEFKIHPSKPSLKSSRLSIERLQLTVHLEVANVKPGYNVKPHVYIHDSIGHPILATSPDIHPPAEKLSDRPTEYQCEIDLSTLRSGDYHVSVLLKSSISKEKYEQALAFTLDNPQTPLHLPPTHIGGHIIWKAQWTTPG